MSFKKIAVFLLALVICVPVFMTSCKDPLKEKMEELDAAYAKVANTYYKTYEACAIAEAIEDEEVKAQFDTWKNQIKDMKDIVAKRLDYNEEEMDAYITEWNAFCEELDAMYEKYKEPIESARAVEGEITEAPAAE